MARRTPVSPEIRDKQRKAVEYRLGGMSYVQIADALGYNGHTGARYAVQRGLDLAIIEPAEEVLQQEVARLDRLLTGLWAKAVKGDMSAVDRVLKIMDRRAKYLGLDAPTRHVVTSELDESIEGLLAELQTLPPVPAPQEAT